MKARLAGTVLLCVAASGCATITNAGHFRNVTPDGRVPERGEPTIRVGQVELKHMRQSVMIYEGNRQIPIRDQADAQHRALHLRLCREIESTLIDLGRSDTQSNEQRRAVESFARAFPNGCTEDFILFPMIELDRNTTHTLRLVENGREATVTVSTSLHPKWLYWNFWLLAAYPIGLATDAATHNWSYFWPIDVAQVLPPSGATAGR